MTEHKSKWWTKMIDIHGSEEAVRDFMAQASNSRKNKVGGYFKNNPEAAREAGNKGRETQRRLRENAEVNQPVKEEV